MSPTRWIGCAGPHCGARLDADSPEFWYSLAAPNRPLQLFCSLGCIARWCREWGPLGWREAGAWAAQEIQRDG